MPAIPLTQLDLAILLLLLKAPAHGYLLQQRLVEVGHPVAHGSIYHSLHKLALRGLIVAQRRTATDAPERLIWCIAAPERVRIQTLCTRWQTRLLVQRNKLRKQYSQTNALLEQSQALLKALN